ncbi:hypothetical protein DFP72DRAFT_1081660 [Ephemerocybe angulata]|uniref:Uncharacterized protein n=1 Tax=Ephemerocybe angulata TaxID=980116 RepID=A0A8H6LVI1_9AGAR|nr:hypothetical protein DFP72DRAFT_1082486 [Tulosesus angulatus]KAF6742701.1 hypothetical protein DFP72DRAFT_1081660 [Tulosesus angulatus]
MRTLPIQTQLYRSVYRPTAKESCQDRAVSGLGKETDSWIWSYGNLRDMDEKEKLEFLSDAEKVYWFRARADMMRWVEEVEILEEDIRRVVRSAERMEAFWTSAASESPKISGRQVYAYEKASMFKRMAVDARAALKNGGGDWPDTNESVVEYADRRRPSLDIKWSGPQDDEEEEEVTVDGVEVGDDEEEEGDDDDI